MGFALESCETASEAYIPFAALARPPRIAVICTLWRLLGLLPADALDLIPRHLDK